MVISLLGTCVMHCSTPCSYVGLYSSVHALNMLVKVYAALPARKCEYHFSLYPDTRGGGGGIRIRESET